MKIVTIVGARPQFIKAGTLSRAIAKHKDIEEVIIHTGQHYDANMSDVFFDEMHIPKPHYYLGLGGQTHGAMTGQMIEKIEAILIDEKPDWLLVYGDTDSTLAGALAAVKLHIKIAHVEAGLRSFNMTMPEEINRILTDRISTLLLCPTQKARQNLNQEGFEHFPSRVIVCGDIMKEGALYYAQFAKKPSFMCHETFVLCTIHRAENTDDETRLRSIIDALNHIAQTIPVIVPLHPRTRRMIDTLNLQLHNIIVVEPLGYMEMIWLLQHTSLVLTDSGGLQKEAYFFHKKCLTLRDETEWQELVELGANELVGADTKRIIDAFESMDTTPMPWDSTLYGDDTTSEKILLALKSYG